jgi:hypothetical protein
MKKFQALAFAVLGLVLLVPLQAYAIENGGVGGRPAHPSADNPRTKSIFIYELKAGQSQTDGVLISNNTDTQQTVSVYPVDSVLSSGGAFACEQAAEPRQGVGSWVTLSADSIMLEPNSTKEVPFTITVPANAEVGEHDGCIAIQAQSQTSKPSGSSGVVLSFRSAIRVVVTVPGKIIKKLSITSVKVSPVKGGKYRVETMVRNDGNVSLDTSAKIRLVSLLGQTVSTFKVGSSPVLAHSTATWNYEVERPFWGGFYRAQVEASYDSNTASQLGTSKNATPLTKDMVSALFFAAPKPAAAAIEGILLLLIVVLAVLLLRRTAHKRHVRDHWASFTVEKGDTVESLAKAHGVSWKKIAKANKLKPPYHLQAGRKIKLPASKD